MCTVTYISTKDGFLLTSNRDEQKTRSCAIKPSVCDSGDFKVVYPKDPDGKGSWIAINTAGIAVVLLNGAFIKHKSRPSYQKSRGLILMEIINSKNPRDELNHIILAGIEPFTLIICKKDELTEFRWDGVLKYIKNLDSKMAKIWSSATLYDEPATLKRADWFRNWQRQNPAPERDDIIDFHHYAGEACFEGLIINREKVKTVSVTSIVLKGEKISMTYKDLQNETIDDIEEVLH